MRRSHTAVALTLAASLVSALALVGGSSASQATPYGKWKARMTKNALLDFGVVDPRAPGTWRLELRRNGTYRTYNPLDGWGQGTLKVSGQRLYLGKDAICHNDGTVGGRAVYTWSITQGKLRLISFKPDPCGGRWGTLTIPVWGRA